MTKGGSRGDFPQQRNPAEVLHRAGKMLADGEKAGDPLLDMALYHLTLGRAHLALALAAPSPPSGNPGPLSEAAAHLDRAVNGLRQSGQQDDLPRGLLARAALRRFQRDLPRAAADLAEARDIAERGGMRLHLADVWLETCRLRLAEGDPAAARAALGRARDLVTVTGYHRRDGELARLTAALDPPAGAA